MHIQFQSENLRQRDHLESLGVDGNSVVLSSLANYTDRTIAAGQRS
jgi:hypothetical protein